MEVGSRASNTRGVKKVVLSRRFLGRRAWNMAIEYVQLNIFRRNCLTLGNKYWQHRSVTETIGMGNYNVAIQELNIEMFISKCDTEQTIWQVATEHAN
jgi:hypothetical protein